MRSKQQIVPYLLLLPALVLLLVFNLLPTIATLVESTFVISLRSGERVFAGFANFERIFNDPI
ncbi:MAG: sugar ABC transporter permease, partial [Chloroflexi bacterium]|nr:sugar ABC transporter permease [Chloroflexota bacterium]